MRFKPLPIEEQINNMSDEKAKCDFRADLVEALLRHPAFQLIVCLLRDIEREGLHRLKTVSGVGVEYTLGRIQTVEYIREAINGLVPGKQIDWVDEELEEFMPPNIADF